MALFGLGLAVGLLVGLAALWLGWDEAPEDGAVHARLHEIHLRTLQAQAMILERHAAGTVNVIEDAGSESQPPLLPQPNSSLPDAGRTKRTFTYLNWPVRPRAGRQRR